MIEKPQRDQEWEVARARYCNVSALYMKRSCGLALKLHYAGVLMPLAVRTRISWLGRRRALANLVEKDGGIIGVDLRWGLQLFCYRPW
jgi:hypothetical protein